MKSGTGSSFDELQNYRHPKSEFIRTSNWGKYPSLIRMYLGSAIWRREVSEKPESLKLELCELSVQITFRVLLMISIAVLTMLTAGTTYVLFNSRALAEQ